MNIEKELFKLMKKAYKQKEIPVACIIVYKNKIIAKAYNKRQKNKNVLGHAEIIAIKKASKKLKDWRLTNCELYVTVIPCQMCKTIIQQSRIKKVYYYLDNPKNQNNKVEYIKVENKINEEYKNIIQNSFKKMR